MTEFHTLSYTPTSKIPYPFRAEPPHIGHYGKYPNLVHRALFPGKSALGTRLGVPPEGGGAGISLIAFTTLIFSTRVLIR